MRQSALPGCLTDRRDLEKRTWKVQKPWAPGQPADEPRSYCSRGGTASDIPVLAETGLLPKVPTEGITCSPQAPPAG